MMKTIDPNELAQHHLHRLLISAVAPRPIAFVSTVDNHGRPNLAPFSCFNMFGVNPSTLIFSPSRSGRTNELKDTYLNIKEVPEAVINVVNFAMLEQMNLASTAFERGVNEYYKAGLTPLASAVVRPFRVKESPVQIECSVRDVIETGHGAGAANLVICEAVMIHVAESVITDAGTLDPNKLDLIGRMGGDYYVRASGKALFQLAQPRTADAIGVDALTETIRMSKVLTGNDLGKLGSLHQRPTAHEIEKYASTAEFHQLLDIHGNSRRQTIAAAHSLARAMIEKGHTAEALILLLAAEYHLDSLAD